MESLFEGSPALADMYTMMPIILLRPEREAAVRRTTWQE